MTLETIYRPSKKFRRYELIEPADDDGITALAGCHLTFYLFDHNFASPNNCWCIAFVLTFIVRHVLTAHYKTIGGRFPEKQTGT
jgi:hypothetical protein